MPVFALLLLGLAGGDTMPTSLPPPLVYPPPLLRPAPPTQVPHSGEAVVRPKLLNQQEIFDLSNYPFWAKSTDEEGRVQFVADISSAGTVTACRITQSSGSASLDLGTCDLVTSRGRFEPARDKNGKPVASDYRRSVVWQLLQREQWRVQDSRTRIIYSVGPNLLVTDCRVEENPPNPDFDPRTCAELRTTAQILVTVSPAEFDWKAWDIVLETTTFAGAGDGVMMVGKSKRDMLFDRDVTRMTIGPDGRIKQCETIELGKNPFVDKSAWCAKTMRVSYFEPVSDNADRLMTSVTAIYLRKK